MKIACLRPSASIFLVRTLYVSVSDAGIGGVVCLAWIETMCSRHAGLTFLRGLTNGYGLLAGGIPVVAILTRPGPFFCEYRDPAFETDSEVSRTARATSFNQDLAKHSRTASVATGEVYSRQRSPSQRLLDALERASEAYERLSNVRFSDARVGNKNENAPEFSVIEKQDDLVDINILFNPRGDPSHSNNSIGCVDRTILEIRCLCEEAVEAFERSSETQVARATSTLQTALDALESFQSRQRSQVNQYLDSLLPRNSIRARLFSAARSKSEKRNAAALDDLIRRGGSIRDKYRLLWQQQWVRRESIVSIANVSASSGVMRFFVEYMAGVPPPVLDLARGLNSEDGPAAHVRTMFADALSSLKSVAARIRFLSAVVSCESIAQSSSPDEGGAVNDFATAIHEVTDAFLSDVCTLVTALEGVMAESFDLTVHEAAGEISRKKEKLASLRKVVAPKISADAQP